MPSFAWKNRPKNEKLLDAKQIRLQTAYGELLHGPIEVISISPKDELVITLQWYAYAEKEAGSKLTRTFRFFRNIARKHFFRREHYEMKFTPTKITTLPNKRVVITTSSKEILTLFPPGDCENISEEEVVTIT